MGRGNRCAVRPAGGQYHEEAEAGPPPARTDRMAARPEHLLRHIRRLVSRPHSDPDTDAALLDRFVRHGEEAAFALLVARHGPMVLGVCRRVLGDAHEAEDAFQATFLVLARKAATVVRREK